MKMNKNAIAEFLGLQYVLGDHTFRKGENKMKTCIGCKRRLPDSCFMRETVHTYGCVEGGHVYCNDCVYKLKMNHKAKSK